MFEIGYDELLRPLEFPLAITGDKKISLGEFGSPATSIPRMLRGISKSGRNLDSSLSPQGEEVFLGKISLILPDVHVVKLGGVSGLHLDLLRNFLLA